jgi:PKD repeat protein
MFTYAFGNTDLGMDNVLIDYYYRKLDQPKPEKPVAMSPSGETGLLPLLVASEYVGVDSLMSVKFQITDNPGDYSNLVLEKRQDWVNIYGDSGAPDYIPTDLNEGIDLRRLQVNAPLIDGNEYAWRVSYRDHNQKWSDWSDEQVFTANSSMTAYTDFSANITTGVAPLSISFTDLSYPASASWSWDFDDDGSDDSNAQDPQFTYTFPGFYTVKLTTPNGTETKDLYINVEENTVNIIENNSTDLLRINPNPCFDFTNIEFYLNETGKIKLTVLDSQGKTISVLENGKLNSGKHTISWNLKTTSGQKVSAGNYFIKLESATINEVKKIVVTEK